MAGAGEAVGDSLLSTSGHHTTGEMMNLKRSIGLFTGCSIIVGVIIGNDNITVLIRFNIILV